jgi:hypothetical protein
MIEVGQICSPSVTHESYIESEHTFEHWVLRRPHTTDPFVVGSPFFFFATKLVIVVTYGSSPETLEALHLLKLIMQVRFVEKICNRRR